MREDVIGLLFLLPPAVWDVKHRSVPPVLVIWTAATGLGLRICDAAAAGSLRPYLPYALGLLPGLLLLLASPLTRGAVGVGDGLMLLALHGWLKAGRLLTVLLLGLALTAAAGLVELAVRRPQKAALPFLPFLAAGYACLLLGGG